MDTVKLRKADPRDSEFACSVKKAAFRQYVETVWGWDEEEQRQLHERRFQSRGFQIVTLDDADIGVMAVVTTSECVKVNQLFLLPEHQGKGVGQKCMSVIMAEAQRQCLPVHLRVLKVNQPAQRFFKKIGFVSTGETDTHIRMKRDS